MWAETIARLAATEVFVYVDNYFEGFAPETAAKLQSMLGLSIKRAEDYQEQPSLFE
jgi:uncharacterized protein YecE (DUF72 family)